MLPIRNGIEVFIYNVNTFELIFYIAGDIQVSRFPPTLLLLVISLNACQVLTAFVCRPLIPLLHQLNGSNLGQHVLLPLWMPVKRSPPHTSYLTSCLITCVIMRDIEV